MICRCIAGLAALFFAAFLPRLADAQGDNFTWQLQIEAPDELRTLLETHLEITRYRGRPEVDALLLDRLIERSVADARLLLATEGYFLPQITVTKTQSESVRNVRISVVPGESASISSVQLHVIGDIAASMDDAVRIGNIRKRWSLPLGARFRQAAWDKAKDAVLTALVLDGFPTARIEASEALVDPASHNVAVSVRIASGPLFHFGAVEIMGLVRYPRDLVENLSTIRRGERYTHDALLRYQAALQGSGYFSSASVSVDPKSDEGTTQPAALPILVRVIEHPAKKLDLGLGYSTDTGPRARAGFTHYNAFQPGWRSQSKLTLEGKQQSLDTELAFLPESNGWRNRVAAEAYRTDVKGLVTQRLGLSGGRAWRSPRMERDITIKLQAEEQRIDSLPIENVHALSANYSWTLRRVDDLLHPKKGYLLNLQLGGAAKQLLSSRSFVRAYGRGIYVVPLGRSDRLHLRVEAGAVRADSREGIPSEFLFRAGGDQSIRGYAYQSLGVSKGEAVVGARYLFNSTLEYQHDFTS
jgi:translocation and assembly module TamA